MMHGMTEVETKPCIVAVSGGVDSVVLLDILATKGVPMIVAHVDHGIRPDSYQDEAFVRELAAQYDVPFVSTSLHLGPSVSEEAARIARYAWLDFVRHEHRSPAVVTAHHQDDVLETMMINIVRGTGWRGLCSLRDTADRHRPLLSMSKAEIVEYAHRHGLKWREDSTNESLHYLRNRIRHQVLPRMSAPQRRQLIHLNHAQCELRPLIDQEVRSIYRLYKAGETLSRYPLIMCHETVAYELLRTWLDESLEKSRLRDLLIFAKTAQKGAKWSLDGKRFVMADVTRLIVLAPRD